MSRSNMAVIALAIAVGADGSLPKEFRLFTPGWNETENGRYLFDAEAARETMTAYAKWGVDLAIDLEHQMLDGANADPTARDARGWCRLELRGGELWAVNVSWTPDGAARLSDKRQRYVSPAFNVDPETKRITSILNVAITSIPATHGTPALVAASATTGGGAMTVEEFMKVMKALGIDPSTSMDDAMARIKGGDDDGPPSSQTGGAPEPPVANAADPNAPPAPGGDKEKKEDVAAASARLMRLTGAKSFVAAVETVDTFRTSHLELETERQKLSAERATLESAERRKICVELIALGAEFPSTVWADEKAATLKARWLEMPIEALRAHATEQRAARAGKGGGKSPPVPPVGGGNDHGLTASELEKCSAKKIDPAAYAKTKAAIAARSGARGAQET